MVLWGSLDGSRGTGVLSVTVASWVCGASLGLFEKYALFAMCLLAWILVSMNVDSEPRVVNGDVGV